MKVVVGGFGAEPYQMPAGDLSLKTDEAGNPYRQADSIQQYNRPEITISYSVYGNEDYEIVSATFEVTNDRLGDTTNFIMSADSYFQFLASIPYTTSNEEEFSNWLLGSAFLVMDGSEPQTTTIGDATFTVTGTIVNDICTVVSVHMERAQ